jgi:hypothetical protein
MKPQFKGTLSQAMDVLKDILIDGYMNYRINGNNMSFLFKNRKHSSLKTIINAPLKTKQKYNFLY